MFMQHIFNLISFKLKDCMLSTKRVDYVLSVDCVLFISNNLKASINIFIRMLIEKKELGIYYRNFKEVFKL